MIDEQIVVTAKFWEALRTLRASFGLRDDEFEQFALMVPGLYCVKKHPLFLFQKLNWVREKAQIVFEISETM